MRFFVETRRNVLVQVMNNPNNIMKMFSEKKGALQTQKSHQVSLHVLRLHPLLQVADGVESLVLDEDQF